MLKLFILTWSFSLGSIICNSLLCPISYVIFPQLEDYVCDSICNTSLCGFDSTTSPHYTAWTCNESCLDDTSCDPDMLGDGKCQDDCISLDCGLDSGDCGYCALYCKV